MPSARLDHLVIVAPTLESGADYVERALGTRPHPGGEHVRMGTHNCLLRLGDSVYLEVIAVDPEAADPGRARWFDLDHLPSHAQPRLATWVVRCDDIDAAAAASPIPLGSIEPMSRGDLEWLITIPQDGRLQHDGLIPTLIQWTRGPHPTGGMPDPGTRLVRLELASPHSEIVNAVFGAIGFDGGGIVRPVVADGPAGLSAWVRTVDGLRRIPVE